MNKNLIKNKIDQNIFDEINSEIQINELMPSLSYNRFDLAFKLLYLEAITSNKSVNYVDMYEDHIRAFSLGSYTEPGQEEEKNSIGKYKDIFNSLYDDIRMNGYDEGKSLVPLAIDGSILNGAHRTSISIFLKKRIKVVQTQLPPLSYDYNFFYKRNVSNSVLDKVATKFIESSSDTYIAFIWPTAKGKDLELEKLFPNIVYKKELKLNANGAHNLLSQIYEGESWLGTVENNFSGVVNKLVECFKTFDPVRVVAFQAESLDKVLQIKENVRTAFGVGKHSIHITDTHEEAIRTARCVFNDNGIHFLNYAKPNKYLTFSKKINRFTCFLKQNNALKSDFVLDSSITLEAYGLRQAKDIDYLSCSEEGGFEVMKDINSHDEELRYHKVKKEDLIYNSDNFFYFRDLKFVSFLKLYHFKKMRAEEKDINDCLIMEALVENNNAKRRIASFKQLLLYKRIMLKHKVFIFMQKTSFYKLARLVYRFFKK